MICLCWEVFCSVLASPFFHKMELTIHLTHKLSANMQSSIFLVLDISIYHQIIFFRCFFHSLQPLTHLMRALFSVSFFAVLSLFCGFIQKLQHSILLHSSLLSLPLVHVPVMNLNDSVPAAAFSCSCKSDPSPAV